MLIRRDKMIHIFIVNPYAGKGAFADDLRLKLSRIEGLNYFVFSTRYKGHETELVKEIQNIFENEKLRFYCCGGSGTMRNMLNGFEKLDDAEIAFFPCGLTNDFLKMFDKDEARFHDIEELINGDIIDVDYIKSTNGVMLNTLSLGMDLASVKKFDDLRLLGVLGETVPYVTSILYAMFVSKNKDFFIELDSGKYEGEITELCFGNGKVLGGELTFWDNASVVDGVANYRVVFSKTGFSSLPIMNGLIKKDYNYLNKISKFGQSKHIRIRRKDGGFFSVNQDGEIVGNETEWEAHIVKKGLHLVVPKGVTL